MNKLYPILIAVLFSSTSCLEIKRPYTDDYSAVSGLKDRDQWGPYNVHDPSCIKSGDTYYMYSTDACFGNAIDEATKLGIKTGNIQVRRSSNLIDWQFIGWALDSIPGEAVRFVHSQTGGKGADNIWAPFILKYRDIFRLYFCVSAFGENASWLGLAESSSPEGPWVVKGCVVRTMKADSMNAIDPSIVTDPVTGEQWLHYGSYFNGLYCVRLNPETGMTLTNGNRGKCIVHRSEGWKNNVEAPEIVYNPSLGMYFLFMSYDPLMTTYNIRVGRSSRPDGPFLDFFGNDLRRQEDHFPILTHAYRFNNHPGWAGTGHCSITTDGKGSYYALHQGRLSPENQLMDLHVRQIFWTRDGWPVFSPERYAGVSNGKFSSDAIVGKWEIIVIKPSMYRRSTVAGQILWGENRLADEEVCTSSIYTFRRDGSIENSAQGMWKMQSNNVLSLRIGNFDIQELFVHRGFDWENDHEAILFSGLDGNGYSIWGKKLNSE